MRNKTSVVILCAVLLCAFVAGSLVARDDYKERTTFRLDHAPKYSFPLERLSGPMQVNKGDADMATIGLIPTNSPGVQAGLTTYDYQHNGAMGRQIAFDPSNNLVHFVWMAQTNFKIPGDRGIKYNGYDAPNADWCVTTGGKMITDLYSGYTSLAALPDGRPVFACHTNPNVYYNSMAYYDWQPCLATFLSPVVCTPSVDSSWYLPNLETIWPIIDVHSAGGDVTENVTYVLTHVFTGSEDLILYRKIGLGETGLFDGGKKVETVTNLAYTINADPNSNNVVIVYTDDRTGAASASGGQTNVDVYYMLSTDQGVTWEAPINVSNYTGDSLWRAYSDLSAVYTQAGELHIVWCARELRDSINYENSKSRLIHWSTDIPQARIVAEARYDMEPLCDPGAWNMYIAKPSISWCDGRMYALWTQFGHAREVGAKDDCSQKGFANGELYLGVSDDNGLTWDLPQNLTNSRNDPPGNRCDSMECNSDHWSSMAKYGMIYPDPALDTLDIQYINDKDAGGIPQGEGSWCVNPVLYLRVPCRNAMPSPQVSLNPNEYLDPLHVAPGVSKDSTLTAINVGNALLTGDFSISYVGLTTGWLTIDGGPTKHISIPSGLGNSADYTIRFNATLTTAQPKGYDAYIILISNAAATSPDTIKVHLTVATDFDMPQSALLNTTCKSLKIWNTGRSGDHLGPDGAMAIPGDCDTANNYPDAARYLYDGSPMLAWLNGTTKKAYTSVFDQQFTETETWRPQTPITVVSLTGYDKATYTASTSDSIFAADVEMYCPTDEINCFIVQKVKYYLWGASPTAKSNVMVGYFMDWDTPSDTSVNNGSDTTLSPVPSVWQFGAEYHIDNSTVPCNITESDRLGGLAILKDRDTIPNWATVWTKENAPNQQGSGFKPGFVYDNMNKTGVFLYTDPDPARKYIDLHTGISFEKIASMTAGNKYEYTFVLVTTNTGEADYLAQVAAAKTWAKSKGLLGCCKKAGDANGDGITNVGDAVYVINFVFKGGLPPICRAEGDANGDKIVNVGDAVYVINFVFKGGPLPICLE